MKKTIIYIVLATLCPFLSVLPVQVHAQIKTLKVGDKVPDITISNVINYKTSSLKLSDFKGKLLILDFWATWCGACLKSIPKTDSLQKEFERKVVFLSVTYQTDKEVDAYLTRLEQLKPNVTARIHPRIVEDKVLHQLFPHTSLPHYVWIDGNGIIKAISEFQAVTSTNISFLLEKGFINTSVKNDDPFIPYDKEIPILSNLGGNVPKIVYQTLLSGYSPGLQGGMDILPASDTHSRKIILRNVPLTWHYRAAYGAGKKWFGDASMILEVKDLSKLEYPKTGDYNNWIRENGFCYELQLPKAHDNRVYLQMQEDLKRSFPEYEAFTELRKHKVLALVRTSDTDKIASKGGQANYKFSGLRASMQNMSLNMLTSQLSILFLQNLPIPIVNDTGYRGKADLEIDADLSDLKALNRELQKYDLQFIEKEKEIEILVIRERADL